MAKMIHSMIRVKDADRSIKFYHDVFALVVKRRIDFNDFSLIYLGNNETSFELELTWNHDTTVGYTIGNGYGHLAFATDSLQAIYSKAQENSYCPKEIKDFYNQNVLIARFFFIKDPDGYDIEVIEKSDVYR
ncbi:lactoylglutathione lyase [Pseudoalteromonas piscicida]|uniref:Aldoketomutase n=1 Tax=Pseudoalteromonas piscicida TaxID=43662 RepID=A0AAQ2EVW2_PSEO7|nr:MULTISPECIES: VOC family protein [Pseudoalteromonas]KJY90482.1 lactoylglutathione lyase [Pseudoalteromonas piscicida]MDP4488999.1 VOC family protein [Pseudoalteromonas piscicida]TMN43920.1 lactoylglutathione lyase [Pseudoalteromonas piscicida]TMN44179.1 lactoylglutathione lyase [Pseudoalteromonas piscicida]TMN49685.1 lactoylglutathione lyase [Pseudoalteromonas piscicida]